MNCKKAGKLVDDLVDGRIDAAGERDLRSHCDDCAECAAALEAAESFVEAMKGSFGAARPPAALRERVFAAVRAEGGPRARRLTRLQSWIRPVAAAAAVLLVAALGFLVLTPDDRGDSDSRSAAEPKSPGRLKLKLGVVVAGTVEVLPRGGERFVKARTGQELAAGDTVRVGDDGPAEIGLSQVVKMVLDAGSEAVIAPDPSLPCDIRLECGRLFAEVEKGTPFRVLTSEGNVKSLGTRFVVSLGRFAGEDGGLAVAVEEGVVEVEREGERETVEAGNCLLLRRGCRARREGGEGCRRRLGWVESCRQRQRRRGEGKGECKRKHEGGGKGERRRRHEGGGNGRGRREDRGR